MAVLEGLTMGQNMHLPRLVLVGKSYCQIWCSRNESGGDLIDFGYLDSIFEFDAGYDLRQVFETA